MSLAPRLYVFDVDGTLRWTTVPGRKYPHRHDEWRLMPNVTERLRAIPWGEDGPWLGIASNQNGVGDGVIEEGTARGLIDDLMSQVLGPTEARVRIEMCICSERANCACRKPEPGLLLRLLDHYAIQPGEALFIGDLPIDEEAARRAGVPFMWAGEFFGW
jgi:D-glycero-D-manno-heptose 1,7-bisphosphate phosphatase